jgi:Peptide-N-glycosidase F, C terminal
MEKKMRKNGFIGKFLILNFLLGFSLSAILAQDTVKIIFFQDSNIQQFRGVEWHRIAQKIPKGNFSKAILQIDLGCATYGCCAWDYTYRGFFSKKVNDTSYNDIEVARLITPYSSFMRKGRYGYDSSWVHPYVYDVTDYLPLLIGDSVFYSASTGGWDDKGKFGFKHTVTLYLIKGDTLRNPARVISAFQDNYRYQDSAQMDSVIQPFKFRLKKGENYAKLRTIITGHDQEGEFSPIQFYVKLNGKQIYQKRLWKTDCDKNPIQPQSGTWIFSRTNWCPGEKVNEIEVHLGNLNSYDDNEVEIVFGKIQTETKKIHALYSVESHVITYGYKDSFDVAMSDIISPSRNPNYRMYNPSCSEIRFLVKNEGTQIVKKIVVIGEDDQGLEFRANYETNMLPYQKEQLAFSLVAPVKYIKLRLEENKQNRNRRNDINVSSGFSSPKCNVKSFIFETTTTSDSSTNILFIKSTAGDTILFRNYFNNNTTYRDTIQLAPNCYHLELLDYDKNYECGDGLSFWYSSRVMKKTSGIFKIFDEKTGKLLKVFNPDFGGKINYEFRVE